MNDDSPNVPNATPPSLFPQTALQAASNQINNNRENLTSLLTILSRLGSISRRPPYGPSILPRRQMPSSGYIQPSVTQLDRWSLACTLQQELWSLKCDLAVIRNSIGNSRSSSSEERDALAHAEQSLSALEGLHQTLLDSVPVTARPTAASAAKAREVFAVEELLEKILLECDFHHLLATELVNRTFAQALKSSNRLRERMGLRPAIGCSPFSPLASSFFATRGCIVRFEYRHPNGYRLPDDEIALSVWFNDPSPFEEQNLPNLGERFRSMLICQPPVMQMAVRTDCCNNPRYRVRRLPGAPNPIQAVDPSAEREEGLDHLPVIRSASGIVLGQIVDETKRLRREHRCCPNAYQGLHRDDGTVSVGVHFEAILKLSSGDPLSRERRQARETLERDEQETEARDARMQAYIAAKQLGAQHGHDGRLSKLLTGLPARDNGRPIATLEEFEATAGAGDGGPSSNTPSS